MDRMAPASPLSAANSHGPRTIQHATHVQHLQHSTYGIIIRRLDAAVCASRPVFPSRPSFPVRPAHTAPSCIPDRKTDGQQNDGETGPPARQGERQGFFRIIKNQRGGGDPSPKTPSPPPQTKVTIVGKNEITSKRVVRSSAGAYAIYPPFLGSFAYDTSRYGTGCPTPCKIIISGEKMIPQ